MEDDFDYNDTAAAPTVVNDFLLENLCGRKGQEEGGYKPPAPRSASKRWKNLNEQNMMAMLEERHVIKKLNFQKSKEQAREIIRKIPVEVLAKEWLSKEDATVDMRAYLVDHVLPTLILGVERLLKEVDEKGLSATNRYEPEFNPINFLAQYLMRNNPRFSNFSEASPYVRGLREVSEEIKQELFTFEDNRLARIKAEARRKRAERERIEQQQQEAKLKRLEQLTTHFQQWSVPVTNNKVELAMVQNALRSFCELAALWPKEMREAAKFGKPLDPTDETGKMLSAEEFAQYLTQFVEELSMDIFDAFMIHMNKCATIYRAAAEKEIRRNILTNLFLMCDHGRLGLLDRQRILELFEKFWDGILQNKEFMGTLRNPRRFPVIEVDEVDDSMFDAWEEEPDGGLTLAEMQIASVELAKVQQEVHRLATIATVQDKSAVEKWKIKQLSEKSEGNDEDEIGERVEEENQVNDIEVEQKEIASETAGDMTEDTQLLLEEKSESETLYNEKSQSEVLQKEIEVQEATDKEADETVLVSEKKSLDNDSFKEEPVSSRDAVPENSEEPVKDMSENSEESVKDIPENSEEPVKDIPENSEESVKDIPENSEEPVKDIPENSEEPVKEVPENSEEPVKEVPENPGYSVPEENTDKTESSLENNHLPSDLLGKPGTLESQDDNAEMNAPELNDGDADKQEEKRDSEKDEEKNENLYEKVVDNENSRNAESEKELATQKEEEKEKDDADDAYAKSPHLKRFDSFMISQLEGQLPVEGSNSPSRAERNAISTNQRSQSQLSAFDESTLNISQFVLLIETLLGHDPSKEIFERLVKHIRDGYTDTEQEKMDRLVKTRRQVISSKRKLMIDNLFEKWDNDGSGYLEMEEIQEVLFKYKDGQELDVIKRAQNALRKKSKFHDQRLSKQEFRELIELVVKEMSGSENFEQLVEFLMNSVERSYAERIRGEARKKWLQQIISAGQVSGTLLDPVYKSVFQALYKDAEMHGGEKRISANISMLESNKIDPSRGTMILRYAACTPEDCPYMLGKTLFKNMKGVSFQAVETGKPVHVPRVSNHGNIYFWNYDRTQEEREGSFVAVPLKDKKKRVFGVLGIDTIQDPNKKSIFITHEIQFFQGVAKAFSIAYHSVEMRRKLLRVAESAISWLQRRCPHITEIIIYLVEPKATPNKDPVLRKMIVAKKGSTVPVTEVIRLERKDNLFRDYLFQCMENSETVCADAYGERHTALPLRDLEGKAIGVLDISIGDMKQLPHHENREAQRMLRLLQKAVKEIIREAQGEEKKKIIDAESDEASRVAIMFDSLMLAELRENVSKLDPMAWAELKSYYQPPKVILEICRAALAIFDIERAGEGQYEDWPIVKNNIHLNLIHQIKTYDPTKVTELAKTEKIARYLRAIPHGEVGRYGSIPAMLLYNWVFCCLSLIEHTIKMRELEAQNETIVNIDPKPSITK